MTIFDHLNNIYVKKPSWNTIDELDRKTFSGFMANKCVSMLGKGECHLADALQKYKLEDRIVYTFYKSYFPVKKRYSPFIKGVKEKSNMDLAKIIADVYEISIREAVEYIEIIPENDLVDLLQDLGIDGKEIKKLTK